MSYDGKDQSIGESILAGAERTVEGLNVAYPYKVIEQDSDTGLVSLEPLIRVRGDDGKISKLPKLTEVPVSYPAGNGYHLFYPLVEGDEGYVVVASRSISQWVESGDAEADPEGRRISSLTDAIFHPGLSNRANPRPELAGGVMSIGSDGGDTEVVVIGSPVRIGSTTASDAVAKSVPVTTDLSVINNDLHAIQAAMSSHGIPVTITFNGPTNNATTKLKAD